MIEKWTTNINLHHLNPTEECIGTYTFNSSNGKSDIDHMLINDELMGGYKEMHITENKELLNISDHCLVRAWFKPDKKKQTKWNNQKNKKVICIKKDEESLKEFVKTLKPKLGKKTGF